MSMSLYVAHQNEASASLKESELKLYVGIVRWYCQNLNFTVQIDLITSPSAPNLAIVIQSFESYHLQILGHWQQNPK
jgi:hypothetical protein